MLVKRLGFAVVAAIFLWGCQGGGNREVTELLTEQQKQARDITQMSKRMDAVDEKLTGIEKSVNALLASGVGAAAKTGTGVVVASNFASTKEYQDIMRQISTLQGQVGSAQQEFVSFRDAESEQKQREALRDRGTAFRAMGDPKELSSRMDNLVKNFSGKIADAGTRSQFVSDVENLKSKFSAQLSPEEKRQAAKELLSARLAGMQDDRGKAWVEGQLKSLDDTSNPQQLQQQIDNITQFQTMREIGELTQKYNVPEDVVRDSGLVAFDRGGPPGFGPGGGGFGPRGGR
jgi:hypothetical protein